MKQMFEKVGIERWSGRKVYLWLHNDPRFVSKSGKLLSLSNVYNLLKNPFYCGVFEYPRSSGSWYIGKHTPLNTQELFQAVQDKLAEETRKKTARNDFTFTKLMTCGMCGSGITAQEKSKALKDGRSTKWYIYYSCTKIRDKE